MLENTADFRYNHLKIGRAATKTATLNDKYESLLTLLRGYGKIAVAFSGGVDSSFLLEASRIALGDRVLAVTAVSVSFPVRETLEASEFCSARGISQVFVHPDQLNLNGFRSNPPDRCYLCKKEIFSQIIAASDARGFSVVCEGSNTDDLSDYRPGLQAICELSIKSPLQECGLSKKEIRALSAELGLPTASKPSFACLATRFPYGEEITAEKITMVDEAEQLLCDLGFRQYRVRIHGNLARIEVTPDEIERFLSPQIRSRVNKELRSLGFTYVSLDLGGYRTGSMNEALPQNISLSTEQNK